MQSILKKPALLVLPGLLAAMAGCEGSQSPAEVVAAPSAWAAAVAAEAPWEKPPSVTTEDAGDGAAPTNAAPTSPDPSLASALAARLPDTAACRQADAAVAWILATDSDPRLRDGHEALRMARRLNNNGGEKSRHSLEIHVAALAELGRFDEALYLLDLADAQHGEAAGDDRQQRRNWRKLLRQKLPIRIAGRRDELTDPELDQLLAQPAGRNAVVLLLAAQRLAAGGQLTLGHRLLELAIDYQPTFLAARRALADDCFRQGRLPEAARHYQALLQRRPDDLEALVNLATLRKEQRRFSEAAALYERALTVGGDVPAVLNALAWLRTTSPDPAVRDPRRALDLARRACATQPQEPRYRDTLAAAYAVSGRFDEALALSDQLLEDCAVAPSEYPLSRAELELRQSVYRAGLAFRGPREAHEDLAAAAWKQGDLVSAIDAYRQALRHPGDHAQVFVNLGTLMHAQGNAAEALDYYLRAFESHPEWLDVANTAAWLAATHHDPQVRQGQLAVILGEHACEATQYTNPQYLETLAAAYAEAEMYEDAREMIRRAIEQVHKTAANRESADGSFAAPDRLQLMQALFKHRLPFRDVPTAHAQLGNACFAGRRPQQAIDHYEQAVRLGCRDPQVRINLATLLKDRGQVRRAIALYEQAATEAPHLLPAANAAAWLQATHPDAAIRNGPRALAWAERVCRDSEHAEPVYLDTLAAAYAECGRFAEAVQTLQLALRRMRESAVVEPASAGSTSHRQAMLRRLEAFENHRPWRESPN